MEPGPDTTPTAQPYASAQFAKIVAAVGELDHPAQIGPYLIQRMIGEGGMGTVYMAEQRTPIRRTVALKVVKLGMDTREVIARFESERQALALMDHPNVAKVLDAGATDTGRPYFVMEFVRGEPITAYADRHKLTVRQRLELFTQACAAIQHAHQKAIIHRDLKPSNVLVTQADPGAPGQVKVIDFGVAKAISQRLTEKTLFTETGQLVGTPEYMAPEQAEGSALLDVDTRSDVYSLGVMLYELISGSLPFDAKTLRSGGYNEIQRIIRETDPPRPSTKLSKLGRGAEEIARLRQTPLETLARQLKSELEWIPLKAMQKERARRYASAAELADDIGNYLRHRPLRAAPDSAGYRLRKFLRRNKAGVAASAAMAFLLFAGIIATTWQAVRATRAERNVRVALGQAQAASARAQAINDFLTQDVLTAATPGITRGKPMSVIEALDNAARTIEGRFKDNADTKASVLVTVAAAYDQLGQTNAAAAHARAALDLCERSLAPDDRVTLSAMVQLSGVLQDQGKLDEAEPLALAAMERARRRFGDGDQTTVTAIRHVGGLRMHQGRVKEAEALCREALELARRHFGNEHDQTLVSLNHMALALRGQGRLEEAEPLLREAVETTRRLRGDDHPSLINAMNTLAAVLQVQGKMTEAVAIKREVLEKSRRVLGEDHLMTITYTSNLADGLAHQGKVDESLPYFRELLEKCRRVLGPDHHVTLGVANNFARILDNLGDWDEAQRLYRDAVELGRKARGIEHPDVLVSVLNYARALGAHGQTDQAEVLAREALETARATLGQDHRLTLALMQELGDILRRAGKLPEAEVLVRESLERRRRVLGENDPDTLSSMRALGDVLLEQRRFDEAEPLTADLYKRAAASDMSPRFVAQCMSQWGLCLWMTERYAEAEAPLREAHRRLAAAGVRPTNRTFHDVVSALADVCDRTNRPDEAAALRAQLTEGAATTRAAPAPVASPTTAPTR